MKCMLYSDINIENDWSLLLDHLISVTIIRSIIASIYCKQCNPNLNAT